MQVLVTGSSGLIRSEVVTYFDSKFQRNRFDLIMHCAALLTYSSVTAQTHILAAQKGYTGQTYRAVAQAVAFAPPGTSVALLFNQTCEPLINHVIFDFGQRPVRALHMRNSMSFSVAETATLPRASARDARALMMMLVDPILLAVKP